VRRGHVDIEAHHVDEVEKEEEEGGGGRGKE